MKSKYDKQRLFEVMGKLDKTFKPTLNENINVYDRYTIEVNRPDYKGTIKRNYSGWMLYDVKDNPEEAGPFPDIRSLMDYYDIDKTQMSGGYVRHLREDANLREDVNLGELNIDEILNSYLETALWAEESDENDLQDKTINDFNEESVANSKIEIYNFIKKAQQEAPDELNTYDSNTLGHNLWLSRNGHGAGFFDDNNDKLQNLARSMKPVDIYLGDDGKIYIS
jgi:hypothetical protein